MKLPGTPWLIVITAVTSAAISGGVVWKAQDWRCDAARADALQASVDAINTINTNAQLQAGRDLKENERLSADLAALRKRNAALAKDRANANLYKPDACASNPFTLDFLRLWNDSAGGRAPSAPAP